MPSSINQKLKIFLCYARENEATVTALYKQLQILGYDPWIDKEMPPGVNWESIIEETISRKTNAAIVCLSSTLDGKIGYMRREIKMILKKADYFPNDDCFLIPVRLDECEVPYELQRFNYVDLFDINGFQMLINALELRAKRSGAYFVKHQETTITENMLINMIHNSSSDSSAKLLRTLCNHIDAGVIAPQVLTNFCNHPYFLIRKIAIEVIIQSNEPDTLTMLYSYRNTSYHVSQALIRKYIRQQISEKATWDEDVNTMLAILDGLSNAKKVSNQSKRNDIKLIQTIKEQYNIS